MFLVIFVKIDMKNIIWILCAPTNKIKNQISKLLIEDSNIIIVICADLNEDSEIDGWLGSDNKSKNIYSFPTNFRSHYNKLNNKLIKIGDTIIKDNDSFKLGQRETAHALAEILNLCSKHNIEMYFANISRKKRSTYLIQDITQSNRILATNFRYNTKGEKEIIDSARPDISKLILEVLMKYDIEDNSKEGLEHRNKLEKQMLISSNYHATYLADVLTVGCMIIDGDIWKRFKLDEEASVETDGTFPKKGLLTTSINDVSYTKARLVKDKDGTFLKFKENSIESINNKLFEILNRIKNNNDITKIFNNSYIFHDSFLNDVDDYPAIELIKILTNSTIFVECNYVIIE